jgi:ribonuclease HII
MKANRSDHPDFHHERQAGAADGRLVCGVDEVGRGPLAGPVMAAAVILPFEGLPAGLAGVVNDSKRLSRATRQRLAPEIRAAAVAVAVGAATVREIEELNILRAALLAMARAVAGLAVRPDHVLVDGRHLPPGLSCPATTIIRGDQSSLSIAAASIVAKVVRDKEMERISEEFPQFGWSHNAGYPTADHLAALRRWGPTRHHRATFAPVREEMAIRR